MKIKLAALGLVAWSACAFAQKYTATQLELLPGGTYTQANAINNAGEAVGIGDTITANGLNTAAAYWNGPTPTVLANAGGGVGVGANAINNSGDVAGYVSSSDHPYPVVWVGDTEANLDYFGFAYGINDLGGTVGLSVFPSLSGPILCPSLTASCVILPTLVGPNASSNAIAINNNGQIVGTSTTSTDPNLIYYVSHATLWTGPNGATVSDLGTLGGGGGGAAAINASGHIVGWSSTGDGEQHATLWYRNQIIDLGTLSGGSSSANGINATGYIVGSSQTATGIPQAVFWNNAKSKPVDLNTEISSKVRQRFVLTAAVGINDHCAILANGTDNTTGLGASFVLSLSNPLECRAIGLTEADDSQDRDNFTPVQDTTGSE